MSLRVPKRDQEGRVAAQGSIGTIVHVHEDGAAYEIEVVVLEGDVQVDAQLFAVEAHEVELTWRSSPPSLASRVRGCLLGGAAGDAYGAPCEGRGVPADLETRALSITDDTQLTLATCEAIVERGMVDPETIAGRFGELFRQSSLRGLGASTYKALSELAVGGHWALVGHQGERSAGNGAAMRIAPLAFCMDPGDYDERRVLRDVCRITHKHDEAYAGALAIGLGIRAALVGDWTGGEGLLEKVASRLPDTLVRDRLRALSAEPGTLEEIAARHGAGGYVVESVPLALLAAQRVRDFGFSRTMQQLVSLGGDSDTLCSLTGQAIGACLGEEAVPKAIVERIEDYQGIRARVEAFAAFVGSVGRS